MSYRVVCFVLSNVGFAYVHHQLQLVNMLVYNLIKIQAGRNQKLDVCVTTKQLLQSVC
jgi:hypothetical protein